MMKVLAKQQDMNNNENRGMTSTHQLKQKSEFFGRIFEIYEQIFSILWYFNPVLAEFH